MPQRERRPNTGAWARLPGNVRRDTFETLEALGGRRLKDVAKAAGVAFRFDRDGRARIRVHPDADPTLVYARNLHTADGDLRGDAANLLEQDTTDLDLGRAPWDLEAEAARRQEQMQAMFMRLLGAQDPVVLLAEWLGENPHLRFYRIGSTHRFFMRRGLFQLLRQFVEGRTPEDVKRTGLQGDATVLTRGMLERVPAALVCLPLTVRFQPQAAVLMTRRGAQVAVVPATGSGFDRGLRLDQWPVGWSLANLASSGRGTYATDVRAFPDGFAERQLEHAVEGANRLFGVLSDPARWTTDSGRWDHEEQLIADATVQYGMEGLLSMASDWGSRSHLFDAFRSLGALQSLWERNRQGSIGLAPLLNPELIHEHAVASFPDDTYRRWAHQIVDTYADMLRQAFPHHTPKEAADELTEVRHLVHGVRRQGHSDRRVRRVQVLDALGATDAKIELVGDIACFWWSAMLFAPDELVFTPPWTG